MTVTETPVVDHLAFQVWDQTKGTPSKTYAWTGTPGASASTYSENGAVKRTNLATDPRIVRSESHAVNGYKSNGPSFRTYNGRQVLQWERTSLNPSGVYFQRNDPALVPVGARVRLQIALFAEDEGTYTIRASFNGSVSTDVQRDVQLPGRWTVVTVEGTVPGTSGLVNVGLDVVRRGGYLGKFLYAGGLLIESNTTGDYFDGDEPSVPAVGGSWVELHDKATHVSIRRGAQQKGAGLETQVGTLDADLYGALDLARVTTFRPNTPIRVVRPSLAPALSWDLMPATAADPTASKGMWPRNVVATVDGEPQGLSVGTNVFSNALDTQWSGAGTETVLPSGTILMASPNTYSATVPNNPKPVGVFDAGSLYTITAKLRSRGGAIRSFRLVVFTGEPESPTIVARSRVYLPADVYPGEDATLTFTAPADDGWQIGLATAETYTSSQGSTIVGVYLADVQVHDHGRDRPEFTGTISDVYQSVELDKATGEKRVFTTVQAVDAVQSLANTDRYGVLARSGAGYQSWADRIDQLATSSLVPIDAPREDDLVVYDQARRVLSGGGTESAGWSHGGTLANAHGYYNGFWGDGEYRVYPLPDNGTGGTVATTLSALNVGRRFSGLDTTLGYVAVVTVTVPTKTSGLTLGTWRLAFDSGNALLWGPAIDMDKSGPQTVAFQFQPTSSYGSVGLYQPGPVSFPKDSRVTVKLSEMRVLRVGMTDPYVLQDVAYESTLLNHFDLACNSVGARWYVTKRGAVLFRRAEEDSRPGARFTDTDAGDVSYTDVQLSYDTRNVVNSLKLNQHGYDPATGNAADVAQTFTDRPSREDWGARAAELDTCLYAGGPHSGDLDARAREVMAPIRQPSYSVSGFTINAQSKPAVLDALELRSTVAVDYADLRQRSRVVSLEHSIDPWRWMVTVTLGESRVGPQFSTIADAHQGLTFAEVNARYRGQTFAEVNALPFDQTSTD